MKYKCIKGFSVNKYDDDGFLIGRNQMDRMTTYSSMFPWEIDQLEKACKENIGYALLQKDCKGYTI